MLNPDDRYYIWNTYRERVSRLFTDVEDVLHSRFAPYNQSEADKDTPAMRKLFDMLADLDAFVERHTEEVYRQYSDWEDAQINAERSFSAWELGLCPEVMRYAKVWAGDFAKIAKLKHVKGISREDTEQAVALWQAQRKQAVNA